MTIVIRGARLVDGLGNEPLNGAVLVIEGQRIQSVGPEKQAKIPKDGATVIDAEGRTVMPALTDSHVGFMRPVPREVPYPFATDSKNIADSVLRAVVNAQRCFKAGITTVRDDTSPHEGIYALKEAFASGLLPGPRLIVPGRGITMTGGHGWYECLEADGVDGVRQAARLQIKAGADWVKLMATAGSGGAYANESPEQAQFTVEEMKSAVDEAHKKGKFAMAHVSCEEGARNAIAAGVDSIEHGLFLDEQIVQDMKVKGIFYVPTLYLYVRLVDQGAKGLIPEWKYKRAQSVVARHEESFHLAMKAGVKIAAGTDAGMPYTPLGETFFCELETMHQQGMDTMGVIVSATRRAAELLRMTNDLGSLEAGKLGDVLVIDGDPLANISDIRKTWMVFKEGQLVYKN
jgi:imidazolonepropionase-like amidohydrolase